MPTVAQNKPIKSMKPESIIKLSIIAASIIIAALMVGLPQYNVYSARKDGEAILAHAQSSREVAVAEAKAKMESASLLAQADTIRACGVAASNRIIGLSLRNNKEYLQWLWIDHLEKANVIYVPTEANLPILEARNPKEHE